MKPPILQMPPTCIQGVLLRSPHRGEGLWGLPASMGRWGGQLWEGDGAEWNRPERQTKMRILVWLWQWELAFLCYLRYQVFTTSPLKSISDGNPDAKDTYLEWMKSAAGCSVVFEPTALSGVGPALRAWETAALGKWEPQLCHCDTHRSGCVLLRGPTLRKACRSWKGPTSCSKSAICWIQHMGQSWHGFLRNSVNSLEICKASWKTPCFHSGHLFMST